MKRLLTWAALGLLVSGSLGTCEARAQTGNPTAPPPGGANSPSTVGAAGTTQRPGGSGTTLRATGPRTTAPARGTNPTARAGTAAGATRLGAPTSEPSITGAGVNNGSSARGRFGGNAGILDRGPNAVTNAPLAPVAPILPPAAQTRVAPSASVAPVAPLADVAPGLPLPTGAQASGRTGIETSVPTTSPAPLVEQQGVATATAFPTRNPTATGDATVTLSPRSTFRSAQSDFVEIPTGGGAQRTAGFRGVGATAQRGGLTFAYPPYTLWQGYYWFRSPSAGWHYWDGLRWVRFQSGQ